ncbi:hypothetical protein ASD24_24605 [Paenibacillus sp. Root52]|uniref:hypothetical protein n=1 Tax=Paenibacillus sp. Root52 TaxID=1736552 RepID=UPI0006F30A5A|nr:hypothetical protein [Paenibacillus sp. Root52]KQY90980.1 hypothetical protein ASD24_24605 [Paenibacillus sp. Root52]
MKVIKTGTLEDGTDIQIEDWSEDYSFYNYADMLASYPISKMTHSGSYAPKGGERYRFSFRFKDAEEADVAFKELIEGKKVLSDFRDYFNGKPEYKNCI